MNIRLIKEGMSKVCLHKNDSMPTEQTIDAGSYPNLVQMLKDCDANENTTGISIIDKHKGYEVMLQVSEGWGMIEKDKGRQCIYDRGEPVEGCPELSELVKGEVDTLASLL
jgi:hypothetical protein